MNENTNLMATALIAFNQLQSLKDKVDPEVYELLNKSGHEAISSAHLFLDACEKALDSIIKSDEVERSSEDQPADNIVNLNQREAK